MGGYSYGGATEEALIGHARCPADEQHLEPDRTDIDYGLSGTVAYGRGLVESLAAVVAPVA